MKVFLQILATLMLIGSCVPMGAAAFYWPDDYRVAIVYVLIWFALVALTTSIRAKYPKMTAGKSIRDSVIVSLVFLVFTAMVAPVMYSARAASVSTACSSNLKRMSLAAVEYAADNDDRFMPGPGWEKALFPYMKGDIPRCPSAHSEHTYALNARLAGVRQESLEDPGSVLFFECDSTSASPVGGPEILEKRHGSLYFGLANGSFKRWAVDSPLVK